MNSPRFDLDILDSSTQFVIGVRELVRGGEQRFLAELKPVVRSRSVRLELSTMDRIDAAGLGALVSLYRDAREAGHEFAVVHPSRHVARILALVGLDRILVSENSGEAQPPRVRMEMAAA